MIGRTALLKVSRETDHGMYLTDGSVEVLLPRREVSKEISIGNEIRVFLYRDSEDRPTATLLKPLAEVNQVAAMEIVDVSEHGAFARWGLTKDLLIPYGEQAIKLTVGQKPIVMVILDETTDRLFGTTKLLGRFKKDIERFEVGQEVNAVVWKHHPKGWNVIVEHQYQAMIYANEHPGELEIGQPLRAWIFQLREDGKIDLRTRPQGFSASNPEAQDRILQALKESGGHLPLGDKSSPESIQKTLGISKKAFKTACGTLFKLRKISVSDDKIELVE